MESVVVSSFCTRIAPSSCATIELHIASCTYVDVGGRLVARPRSHAYACAYGLGDACLVWGRDSCEYECNVAGAAGRPATCSLVPRLGCRYMYNARRNPRSLQYYSRVDVPSTVTPQRLREGDDLQERCVLGSRGVRPHPTNPPLLGTTREQFKQPRRPS